MRMQTVTGRLSCLQPNMQEIPVRSPMGQRIRQAFWRLIETEVPTIELCPGCELRVEHCICGVSP